MPRKLTDSWIHAKTDFGKKKKKKVYQLRILNGNGLSS